MHRPLPSNLFNQYHAFPAMAYPVLEHMAACGLTAFQFLHDASDGLQVGIRSLVNQIRRYTLIANDTRF